MQETLTSTGQMQDVAPRRGRRGKARRSLRRLAPLVTPLALLLGWQLIVMAEIYPPFLIPPPAAVWDKFLAVLHNGTLMLHLSATLEEMLLGLLAGVSTALVLGYLIAKIPLLEDLLSPLIVAFQSTPVVAYAPLLIIWFGSGPTSKVVTCAVIVFFPMLMNTILGLRSVPGDLRDLMRSLKATRRQTFLKLDLPAALPQLLTGLKTSAVLAMIGAVVGEFVSASAGLGYLINFGRGTYDTPLVIAAVFTLTALALLLYGLAAWLEAVLLDWQDAG